MSWKMKSSNKRNGGPLFTLGSLFYGPAGPSRRHLRSSAATSESSERNASSSRMLSGHAIDSVSKRSDSSSEDGSSSVLSSSFRRSRSKNLVECPLCLQLLPKEKFPVLQKPCTHRSCIDCLWQYFKIEVTESRTNIRCPECSELFHPNDIQAILGNNVLSQKYEEFMLRRVLVADPDVRWCPAPDCG
jgi:E3 ubiquitin-protein ligase RNF19A